MDPNNNIISFKTKKEIAAELGISVKTLRKKLKDAGLHIPRGLLSLDMQKKVLTALGFNLEQ